MPRKWEGKCRVCERMYPVTLAAMDPEDRQAIEDGEITPTKGEFMVDPHKFEGQQCSGSTMSPRTITEVKQVLKGVCCSCQSVHLVVEREEPLGSGKESAGFLETQCAEEGYVMAPHNFPGMDFPCSGAGTVPQALFVKQRCYKSSF